jgi:trk system potassium uptake protein TrkH
MRQPQKRFQMTPPQILVTGLGIIILIGAFLLTLPIASTNAPVAWIDALFTATTSTCVTGLVVVDTGTQFTLFGQLVIMVMIQVGGLGFMTMATLIALVFRKRISLRERLILQEAMNQTSMEGIVKLIRKVIIYSLVIELTGALLFAIRWSFDMPLGQAVYYGIFHAISLFNNAGIDLFGSFISFASYVGDPLINIVSIGLITLGGLGFIVLSDVSEWHRRRRLSLHSKVVLTMSGFLAVVGALAIFILEFTNVHTLGSLDGSSKVLASFFQSVTSRTAGAATLDIGSLRQSTQFLMILLMFIGASPGSTGGGIKTTTFAILLSAVLSMIRGKQDIVLFRFRLAQDRVSKAVTITLLSLFLVIFVAMVLSTTEPHPFLMILYEVTSAFSTTGLSMGLTTQLTPFGKMMIILMMFIGRSGPLTLAYALGPRVEKELYRHPEGKIMIG